MIKFLFSRVQIPTSKRSIGGNFESGGVETPSDFPKFQLPETRTISPLNEKILETISSVIDGHVVYEKNSFYVMKSNGKRIEFQIEAEGLRKFGLLWKLIRNGLIEEETVLFWDEPESNINPELIPVLVDILLEMQRKGVQIFIATHNYNIAKYFELVLPNSL